MKSVYLAAALVCMAGAASAATVRSGPVNPNDIISFGGLEWAWASPCGAAQHSCSKFELTTEQAGYGWRLPTAQEVATHIVPDTLRFANAFKNQVGSYDGLACASAWFNDTYGHCDFYDAANGYIWNITPGGSYETFVVRSDTPPAVPLPASLPLLAAGLGALWASRRRKA